MEPFAGLAVWTAYQSKTIESLRAKTSAKEQGDSGLREDCAVVFVEPRKHTSSEYVLRNMRYFLPTWTIIVVHSKANEQFMRDICAGIRGNFKFIDCKVPDLPIPSYNTLFTCPEFWKQLPRYVLIAQTDTLLMKPASEYLESFIARNFSFVGAPWSYSCNRCKKPLSEGCGHMIDQVVVNSLAPHMVGNGGLSFRDTHTMIEICSRYCLEAKPCDLVSLAWSRPTGREVMKGTTNEDVFYNMGIRTLNKPVPSRLEALEFAVEQVAPLSWNATVPAMGAHKPWAYLSLPFVECMLNLVKYT